VEIVSGPIVRAAVTPRGVRAPAGRPGPRPRRVYSYLFPLVPTQPASSCRSILATMTGHAGAGGRSRVVRMAAPRMRLGRPEVLVPGLRKSVGRPFVPRTGRAGEEPRGHRGSVTSSSLGWLQTPGLDLASRSIS